MPYPLYDTDFTKQIICPHPTKNCCFNTFDTSKDGQGNLRKFPFPANSECSLSINNNESNPESEYDDADKNDKKKTQKMTYATNGKTWLSMEKKF